MKIIKIEEITINKKLGAKLKKERIKRASKAKNPGDKYRSKPSANTKI